MPEEIFRNGRWVHRYILNQILGWSRWFCYPPPLLRQCNALFAVAEGWLLLDIGWFSLFFITENDWTWLGDKGFLFKTHVNMMAIFYSDAGRCIQSVCMSQNARLSEFSFIFVLFSLDIWQDIWYMCFLLITRLLRGVGRWTRRPVNHTSWVAVVTPTDRP